MKRLLAMTLALALVLALSAVPAATAEEDELVKGIYEQMLSKGSPYSEEKESLLRYYTDGQYTETFDGNGFTISIANTAFGDGVYVFEREGDYLAVSADLYEYNVTGLVLNLMKAVGAYYGQNPGLVNGYVTALNMRGIENKDFRQVPIPSQKYDYGFRYYVYIAGPLAMKELDGMVLTEEDDLMMFGFMPLEEYTLISSMAFGKVDMRMFGSRDSCVFLAGEYGGLDDTALQDLKAMIRAAQPGGWESFCAEVTALDNLEGPGYTVAVNVDDDAVRSAMAEPAEGYSYVLVRFGSAE